MPKRDTSHYKIQAAEEMIVEALPPLDRHPGVFLRDVLLPEWGLGISELARRLNVNRPNLSEVLAGKRDVSRELAYRLGALIGDHLADFLINYQHQWDLQEDRERREALKAEIARMELPAAEE